jgi:hypothetical protein
LNHLGLHLAGAKCAPDEDLQPVDIQRLGDEVVSSTPHRLDRRVDASVRGHHDHDRRLRSLQHVVDECHPVLAAKAQVCQDEIDMLPLEHRASLAD